MVVPTLIIGGSGMGKSRSIKSFRPPEVGVISVEKGRLPFKSDIKVARIPKFENSPECKSYAQAYASKYAWILNTIRTSKALSIVIDDSQYLLVNEFFDRANETGYGKFTDIALHFRNLIHALNEMEGPDKIVYFLHHCETDADGRKKVKTVGKMLDEKLTVEGCFDIVLYCEDYKFFTQSNKQSTAKTPEGMFDDIVIPNDLKAVDKAIREYYGMEKNDISTER